jgi:hypothetical protein
MTLEVFVFIHLKCYQGIMVLTNDNVTGASISYGDEMTFDERYK